MANYITTARINFRNAPAINPLNVIAVLPINTLVTKIAQSPVPEFWSVTVPDHGNTTGFVAKKYLKDADVTVQPTSPLRFDDKIKIPDVHLIPPMTVQSSRSNSNFRWYQLNELDIPGRIMTDAKTKTDSIAEIIKYLDVEKSARYQPTDNATFCNIYAYDFCCCAGVYLPHVWWSATAIALIVSGSKPEVKLNDTVFERTANSLYNWFVEFDQLFGWKRVFDLTELQDAVNNGSIGIIVGQRVNLATAGHITVTVPETEIYKAERKDGKVVRPLQSQAGRNNHKYYNGNWWSDSSKFRAFGFWIHD